MIKVLERLSDVSELVHLPRFLVTLRAVLLRPLAFFAQYHDVIRERPAKFSEINKEGRDDPYLGPVKFAALVLLIENTLFPVFLSLGLAVGAVSQHYVAFAEWAEEAGYLDQFAWTGVWFVDDAIQDFFRLITFYALGVLIWLFSSRLISVRFATGYFLYINAWSLLGTLIGLAFLLLAFVMPIYESGLPYLVDFAFSLILLFMLLGFPIVFWPRLIEVPRRKIVVSMLLAFVCWITIIALVAPLFLKMPEF